MILKGRENHVLFLRMIDYAEPKSNKIQILKGKKVCISMNYEVDHFKEMIHIIQKIKDAGFKVKLDTNGCFPDTLDEVV